MKKILLLVFITCLQQLNAQVCFYPPTTYATDGNPWGICKGDFNEDGKLDIATANDGTADVSILLGTGTGSFSAAINFTVSSIPITVYSADFNHDGHADLVTCNFTQNKINVLLGTGTGSFSSATTYTTGSNTQPYYATSADYNGDGNVDLAISNHYNTGKISIFTGNGTGSFSAPITYTIGGTTPAGIVSADVNADGKTDLVIASYFGVLVLAGNGNGTFATAVSYTTDASAQTTELVCNDFNADGYLDIVTTNLNSNSLSMFLGNSSGTFGAVTNIPLGTYPFGICCADFNSDGKLDIAVSTNSNNNLNVLLGDGAGSFGTPFVFPLSSTNTRDCVAGDFNSDGKPDVAIAGFTNPIMSVLLNSLPNPVTITGNTTICNLNNTTLTASGTDAYTWSANAASATTNTVNVSPNTTTTYTVSGNNTGCAVLSTKTITVNVNALPPVIVNSIGSTTVCSGNAITLFGTGANTYTWTGGITDNIPFFPIASQNYTVTGTDLHGCNNTATVSIFQPTPITSSIFSQVNVSGCYGQSNGSTAISTSGGYGSLTYNWMPGGATSSSISNLTANIYTCTIADALSCTKTQTVNITQPNAISSFVSSKTNLSCYGANNGTVSISATGGTGTLNYIWSPTGGTADSAINLAAGSYICTITDANSCVKTQSVSITQPSVISSAVSSQTNINGCHGDTTGSAHILASGGTGVLTYSWSPGNSVTDSAINLLAGSYTCTITDANNCMKTQTLSITQPNAITSSISSQNNVSGCYGQSNGAVSISANGGTGALSYNWLPTGGTSITASNLPAGSYTCFISDVNNCIKTQTTTITQPPVITTSITSQNSVTGCYGQNNGAVSIAASGGTGALSYSWAPSGSTLTSLNNLAAGTYTCNISDLNNCIKTQTVTITQPSAITSSLISQNNVSCVSANNGSAIISASGGTGSLNYNWIPYGGSTTAATNLAVGSYTCVITDSNNCTKAQTVTISQGALGAPDICMVTTDSSSGYNYNIVYWDKTAYANADSFIVYRYDVNSVSYLRIGAVSKDSLSAFTDTARIVGGGTHGGDPNYTSWKYKLAIRDTCGNISPQSPYHQTVFLQNLNSGNFGISQYVIETGQSNSVSGYYLYRDDLGNNNYQPLITISGTSATDPNYTNYPNANYRVDILGFSCNPTLRLANNNNNTDAAKVRSHSNQNNNKQTGIQQASNNNEVKVYPNPTSVSFVIESQVNGLCIIYDINGKEVFIKKINNKITVDISSLINGIYNISLISTQGTINKRLVIVK